jgi:uncharacterized protein (DUF983 family)
MTEKRFRRITADIVNGECPTCEQRTMLVGLTIDSYRCVNCGSDLKQHINGKISYIPTSNNNQKNYDMYLKDWM